MIHPGDPSLSDEDLADFEELCQNDQEALEWLKHQARQPHIGYWYSHERPDLPDPRDFIDKDWDANEREMVIEHLRKGEKKLLYCGGARCRICGEMLGGADVTDGAYTWPERFEHYLEQHDVRPPKEFVDHTRHVRKSRMSPEMIERENIYYGQQSGYSDCLPIAMANACRFYGLPCPEPGTDAWEEVVDFTCCRNGAAIGGAKKIAEYFGLFAVPIERAEIVGKSPVLLSVWNPDMGSSLHECLVVGWEDNEATVVNYRWKSGPVVERLPLLLDEDEPKNADGSDNLDVRWPGIYIPRPPNTNGRCFRLLRDFAPYAKPHRLPISWPASRK